LLQLNSNRKLISKIEMKKVIRFEVINKPSRKFQSEGK